MKKFLITEAEKSRILGMHYSAMGKSLVSEQDIPWTTEIMDKTGIRSIGSMETEYMDMGQFEVTFNTTSGGGTLYAYQCITDPREKEGAGGFKGGTVRDYNGEKIVNPNEIGLKGDWLNYVKQYCKPGYDWLAKWNATNAPKSQPAAPAPQVAAATTTWSDKAMADMAKSAKSREEKMAAIQAEAAKVMADTTFLSPEKEKAQLDLDAKTVNSILLYDSYLSEEQKMFLKRKISTLLKGKPEYKNEPFSLNINF